MAITTWPHAQLRSTVPQRPITRNGLVPPCEIGQPLPLILPTAASGTMSSTASTIVPSCCTALLESPKSRVLRQRANRTHLLGHWREEGGDRAMEALETYEGAVEVTRDAKGAVVRIGEHLERVDGYAFVGLGMGERGEHGGSVWWTDEGGIVWTLWLIGASAADVQRIRDAINARSSLPIIPLKPANLRVGDAPRSSICIVDDATGRLVAVVKSGVTFDIVTPPKQPKQRSREEQSWSPSPPQRFRDPKVDGSFIRRAREAGVGISPNDIQDSLRLSLLGRADSEALKAGLEHLDRDIGLGNLSMQGERVSVAAASTRPVSTSTFFTALDAETRPFVDEVLDTSEDRITSFPDYDALREGRVELILPPTTRRVPSGVAVVRTFHDPLLNPEVGGPVVLNLDDHGDVASVRGMTSDESTRFLPALSYVSTSLTWLLAGTWSILTGGWMRCVGGPWPC